MTIPRLARHRKNLFTQKQSPSEIIMATVHDHSSLHHNFDNDSTTSSCSFRCSSSSTSPRDLSLPLWWRRRKQDHITCWSRTRMAEQHRRLRSLLLSSTKASTRRLHDCGETPQADPHHHGIHHHKIGRRRSYSTGMPSTATNKLVRMIRRPQQRNDSTLQNRMMELYQENNSNSNHDTESPGRGNLVMLDDNDLSSFPLPPAVLQEETKKMEMRMIVAGSEGETMAAVVPPLELEYKKLGESQFSTYIHITREHRDDDEDHDLYSSSSSLTDSNHDSFLPPSSSMHSHLSSDQDNEEKIGHMLSSSHDESSLLSFSPWLMGDQDQKFDASSTTTKNTCSDATVGQFVIEPKCVPYAQLCFDPQSNNLVTLMEISVTSKMGTQSKRLCIIRSSKEVEDHDHEKQGPNNCSHTESSTASVRSSSSLSDDEETFPVFPCAHPESPKVKERYDEPIVLATVNYQDSWWEDTDIGLYLLHECQDPWVLTNKVECGCSEAVKKLLTVSKCLIYRTKHSGRDCSTDWKCSQEPFAGLAYSFLSDN